MNAAVEAARAGEAGAGFAVVADEVRNLAMRAADAAKNTSDLIQNTIKAVKNGDELTHMAQEAFKENIDISNKINHQVDEISEASKEQSQGIHEVNRAITEMDDVSQKNAADSEESAASAEELRAQAEEIKGYVHDLVKVVNGSADNLNDRQKMTATNERQGKESFRPEQKLIEKQDRKAAHVTAEKPKEVAPEQVIPLDDDDFSDF